MKNREKGNIPGFSNYYISRTGIELLISRYIEGIPRKDILEEFGISTGVLYKILRYNNIKLRK